MAWPQKILNQIESVCLQHIEDEDRFQKIQMVDQKNFYELLESLEVRAPRQMFTCGPLDSFFIAVNIKGFKSYLVKFVCVCFRWWLQAFLTTQTSIVRTKWQTKCVGLQSS